MRLKILHTIWRLCTLALVVALTFLTAEFFVPYLDRRLPLFPVILLTYLLIAYILIPIIIRFWRLVIRPTHIPRYVTTPDGWPADPINIAVVAKSKRHFVRAMKKAGWYTADPSTIANLIREGYAMIFNQPYPTAPFSSLYLFGRKQDVGFQIPYGPNGSPKHRHHVRFWQLEDLPHTDDNAHFSYWIERVRHLFGRKKTIWIGAAIDDSGIHGIRWRNLQITHANRAEHTKERDFIIATLRDAGLVKSTEDIKDGEPFKMRSQNIGTSFVVDGSIKVVTIERSLSGQLRSQESHV